MRRILKPGVNCMGIYDVWQTSLLVDGREYYRTFYEMAEKAERYIFLTGWQFDSSVRLLRGSDAEEADEVRLLPFLKSLCEKNPQLQIYILAWDFTDLFLINREWFQDLKFNWTMHERVHFRFDNRHAIGASHHEKLVIIDGITAFVGGMDICERRWDERGHVLENPYRKNPKGKVYEPYHDIQSIHVGPVAEELANHFRVRWANTGGELPHFPLQSNGDQTWKIHFPLPIDADSVAISRTRAKTLIPLQESVLEIRRLFIDALDAAEKLIYMETQFFSSQAVYGALADRMRDKTRPKLQIIVVLPRKPHTLLEEISLGLAQMKMLKSLEHLAAEEGHALGVYYILSEPPEKETPVYIHAKILIVDDRFMTLGSANTTNRSLGLDTELNVSWEANSGKDDKLAQSIRGVRASLLREHIGSMGDEDIGSESMEGLVGRLDRLAGTGKCRLRRHTMDTIIGENVLPEGIRPEDLEIDPGEPIVEENIFEIISNDKTGLFSEGITALSDWLLKQKPGASRYMLRFLWKHWRLVFGTMFMVIAIWMVIRWFE